MAEGAGATWPHSGHYLDAVRHPRNQKDCFWDFYQNLSEAAPLDSWGFGALLLAPEHLSEHLGGIPQPGMGLDEIALAIAIME